MPSVRKNFTATLYSNAANVGGQLLWVPVFLRFWGTDRYGAWLVLYTVPACFGFLDVGIGTSLGNALTLAYERKEYFRAQSMLSSVCKYQSLGLAVAFAILTLGVFVFPLRSWLALGRLSGTEIVLTSLMLCLYTGLSMQRGIFTAIFRAAGRFDQLICWDSHARVIEVLSVCFAVASGAGLAMVAVVMVAVRMALMVFLWFAQIRLVPTLAVSWRGGSWADFKGLLSSGIAFIAIPVGTGITNQGSAILLNNCLGPSGVVALSIARQFARLYWNVTSALYSALQPELTRAYASGDHKRMVDLYARGLSFIFWTGPAAILAIGILGPFVIGLWTKGAVNVAGLTAFACGVETVVASLGQNAALPAYASNRHILLCMLFLLSTLGAFVPSAFLVRAGGVAVVPSSFSITGVLFAAQAFGTSVVIVGCHGGEVLRFALHPKRLLVLAGTRSSQEVSV